MPIIRYSQLRPHRATSHMILKPLVQPSWCIQLLRRRKHSPVVTHHLRYARLVLEGDVCHMHRPAVPHSKELHIADWCQGLERATHADCVASWWHVGYEERSVVTLARIGPVLTGIEQALEPGRIGSGCCCQAGVVGNAARHSLVAVAAVTLVRGRYILGKRSFTSLDLAHCLACRCTPRRHLYLPNYYVANLPKLAAYAAGRPGGESQATQTMATHQQAGGFMSS